MFPIRTSVPPRDIPGIVIALIVVNVAVYIFQHSLPYGEAQQFLYDYALVPARLSDTGGPYWSILTSTFMHAGLLHLAVNMWTLWLFGRALEDAFGPLKFLAFYLACGVAGSLSHLGADPGSPIPALGASGAIAGVLGGFTLRYAAARIVLVVPILFFPFTFSLPATVYTSLWFAIQIVPGILQLGQTGTTGGIAWWAHIGGLIAGLGLAWLMFTYWPGNRTRPGRLSTGTGQRARVISVGTVRHNEPISGRQRPNVIRFGGPRSRQQPIRQTTQRRRTERPDPAAAVATSPKPPKPRETRRSSIPEFRGGDLLLEGPVPDLPTGNIWHSTRR